MTEEEALAQGYTLIKTAQDLDNIRNNLSGKYILMNDIDLSSYSNWDPIGEVDLDTGVCIGFTGILDGNGYVIKNLKVDATNEETAAGLFAAIGALDLNDLVNPDFSAQFGEVKNLGLENVDITASGLGAGALANIVIGNITNCYVTGVIKGKGTTGGLVSSLIGSISNCYSAANIETTGSSYYTGGIVGMVKEGSITNCYSAANIEASGSSYYIGGIAGGIAEGGITDCYSTGEIKSTGNASYAGGILGKLDAAYISYCYTTGYISTDTGNGGLIGKQDGGDITNSIWDIQKTGQNTYAGKHNGGTQSNNKGLTTSEMQDPANWAGWDTDIWDFSTYPPTLKNMPQAGQNPIPDPDPDPGPDDPDNPDTPDTPDDPSAIGAIRLQVGANASADANAIIFNTSFDLGVIDVDFSSSQTASNSLDGIDALLDRISKKRSEFGAIMNRLESVLNTQTSQIENLTASKSTIMDADIAQESADYVKNQILQQTTASLLAQAQSANNAVIMALIRG